MESENLSCHFKLLDMVGTQGISSDETDTERERQAYRDPNLPKAYRRILPGWRSLEFTNFMWKLEKISRERRFTPVGRRSKPGSDRCARLYSGRVNYSSMAVPGLPRNCYSTEWLATLRPHDRERLQVLDWDYDWETGWNEPKEEDPVSSFHPNVTTASCC
ncbi:hypothetical protein OF83DRAFT_1057561 [Amylostereum chailletii]|nr:hypothetical protein OF83DRAFT_1057561 [Amylostereum chailletii]